MNRFHHVHFHHRASTHPFVASKTYPPDVVRREVKNLAFDTLPLEEVVKAFKDNKDSRGQRVPDQSAGRYFLYLMNVNDFKEFVFNSMLCIDMRKKMGNHRQTLE